MDLYTLDENFLQQNIVDSFDSVIWTERYNASGDCKLIVPTTSTTKAQLVEGLYLWTPDSKDVVLIDTVSDEDGKLTVTGNTITDILKMRILRNAVSSDKNSWKLTGTPGGIVTTILTQMCMSGGSINSILPDPGYEYLNLTVVDTSGGSSETVAVSFGNVYDGVKAVCDDDDIGFRLYPSNILDGTGALTFDIYRGKDLTSDQSTNPLVFFDSAMESLSNVKELRSIAGYATAAYAWPSGATTSSHIGKAYVSGTQTTVGLKRRTIMVDATDVNVSDYTTAELTTVMNRKAKDALANNNYVRLMDGQLVPQNVFKYGTDYTLGDVIELRSGSTKENARITEYIRAQDNTGFQAYPTLTVVS